MTKLKLKGISNKGKNIIKRDGELWILVEKRDRVQALNNEPGMLVVPDKGRVRHRWIKRFNDSNFEIIRVS